MVTEYLPTVTMATAGSGTSKQRRRSIASDSLLGPIEPAPAKGDPAKDAQWVCAHLCEVFPHGLPARLLVVGSGGTGKTMLTKQIVVQVCRAALADFGQRRHEYGLGGEEEDTVGQFIPFRS